MVKVGWVLHLAHRDYSKIADSSLRKSLSEYGLTASHFISSPKLLHNPTQLLATLTAYRQVGVRHFPRMLHRHPPAFAYPISRIERVTALLTDYGVVNVGRVLELNPVQINENAVTRVCGFLSQHLSPKQVGRIVERCPQVLGLSPDRTIEPKIEYLASFFPVPRSPPQPWTLVTVHPATLTYSLALKMIPVVQYLRSIGVENIGKILERNPKILSMSIFGNIRPTVRYLQSLGIENVAQVIESFPVILGYSVKHHLHQTVDFYRTEGFTDIGGMITRHPPVIAYSIQANVQPKLAYMKSMGVTVAQIEAFPAALGYSLSGRIQPRLKWAQATRSHYRQDGTPCLFSLLPPTDASFARKMGKNATLKQTL